MLEIDFFLTAGDQSNLDRTSLPWFQFRAR